MTTQQISPEAATRREQARDDHGRFGPSSAPETDVAEVDLGSDDPRGEDWYDPDTGGAPGDDEVDQRVIDAVTRLEIAAGEAYERNFQDETSRLHHGKKALAQVFRASHPQVARIHLAEESDGVYVDHAVDHDGRPVDVSTGWPEDTDLDDVNDQVSGLVASPVDSALEHVFPRTGDDMVVDVDATLEDGDPPF